MKKELLDIIVCPSCVEGLNLQNPEWQNNEIIEGELKCKKCLQIYPVHNFVPRFVANEAYSSSFGFQWNKFRESQIDKFNNTTLSKDRFFSETKWDHEWAQDKWILDAGCGAGRFAEIAASLRANVAAVDISNAVDACYKNFGQLSNLHIIQANLYKLPFRKACFDGVYCIGVIQHTPDPEKTIKTIPAYTKKGGRICMTIYPRKRFTKLYMKYIIRPVTKRISQKILFRFITMSMPLLFVITDILFRIPVLKKIFKFLIPVANYVDERQLSCRQRYKWAVLDTFDMLSPMYDYPQRAEDVEKWLNQAGVKKIRTVKYGSYVGQL